MRQPLNRFGRGPAVAPFGYQPTRQGLRGGFGRLGISSSESGAASGAASGASVGSAAGPIGTAAGAVVGAIVGLLSAKSNPQIQIDKNTALQYFQQYTNVVGTVSGRSIGINNMDMVLRGACFNGHFPKWESKTELPDSLLSMPGSPWGNNDNCFAVLWRAAQTGNPAPGSSGVNTGNGGVPVRDAKTFVDRYVWPSNTADVDTVPWVTTTDALGKQIIYDAADAYLAEQDPTTLVLIGQTVQQPTVSLPTTTVINPVGSTAVTTPTYSPSGSLIAAAAPGTLSTQFGTFALSGTTYTYNGTAIANTPTTAGIAYVNGQVYRYDANGATYFWSNGWQATNQAPAPGAVISSGIQSATTTTTVNPVGSGVTTATTQTPAQLVASPPAAGTTVAYAPDMSQGGTPLGLPAGLMFEGVDPYNGSWILQSTTSGQLYVLWQGSLIPYTSTMFAPTSTSAAALAPLVTGSGTTGVNTSTAAPATTDTTAAATPTTQAGIGWMLGLGIVGTLLLAGQQKKSRRRGAH